METEGLDFKGALESLADRFGVRLETEPRTPRRPLAASGASACTRCWGGPPPTTRGICGRPARRNRRASYLLGRGLTEETLREFRVGYAPSAWDRMLAASRRAGFGEEELLATGLAQRSRNRPGQVYDRFRERIMFPAVDRRGRVSASARAGCARTRAGPST